MSVSSGLAFLPKTLTLTCSATRNVQKITCTFFLALAGALQGARQGLLFVAIARHDSPSRLALRPGLSMVPGLLCHPSRQGRQKGHLIF